MEQIFVAVLATVVVIIMRIVFVADPTVGMLITYGAVLATIVIGGRYALRRAPTVRVDGIE